MFNISGTETKKYNRFPAKIFRSNLRAISTREVTKFQLCEGKKKQQQQKKAKQTIFPFKRHLIKNQIFLQKLSNCFAFFFFYPREW